MILERRKVKCIAWRFIYLSYSVLPDHIHLIFIPSNIPNNKGWLPAFVYLFFMGIITWLNWIRLNFEHSSIDVVVIL